MIDYKRPTDEQWGELYPIADEISALSPWTQIPDSNIFVVETPADNEPFFCIILGHAGREGVAMYPGYNAFAWMEQLRLDAPTDIRPMVMMEQRILVLNFGDEEDIQPEDREFINKIGIQCSGKNQWPFFVQFTLVCSLFLSVQRRLSQSKLYFLVYYPYVALIFPEACHSNQMGLNYFTRIFRIKRGSGSMK